MTGTTEFFSNYFKNLPITIVKDMLNTNDRSETLTKNGYSYIIDDKEKYPAVIATKKYPKLDEFTNTTIFKDQYFTNFETTTNNNLVTIKAYGFKPYDQDPEYYAISKFSLNITLPYVVTDSNADSINKETNTYSWKINLDTDEKEIKLTFDKNKIYVYNVVMYISILILIILGIIVGIVIYKAVKKNKLNNKIYE